MNRMNDYMHFQIMKTETGLSTHKAAMHVRHGLADRVKTSLKKSIAQLFSYKPVRRDANRASNILIIPGSHSVVLVG